MSAPVPYAARLEFHGGHHIARWRPLAQWLLAIPQLLIASALRSLRQVLILISLFTVLFTERTPRPPHTIASRPVHAAVSLGGPCRSGRGIGCQMLLAGLPAGRARPHQGRKALVPGGRPGHRGEDSRSARGDCGDAAPG